MPSGGVVLRQCAFHVTKSDRGTASMNHKMAVLTVDPVLARMDAVREGNGLDRGRSRRAGNVRYLVLTTSLELDESHGQQGRDPGGRK